VFNNLGFWSEVLERGLKIRVSVVQFHPWPPLKIGLFRSDR
jgi:hypothetical protein